MVNGEGYYMSTVSSLNGNFDLSKRAEMVEMMIRLVSRSNPFADRMVRGHGVSGSSIILERLSGAIQRNADNFILKNTYRVHHSNRPRWGAHRAGEVLWSFPDPLAPLIRQLQLTDAPIRLNKDGRMTLLERFATLQNRRRCAETSYDHSIVTVTLVGKIPTADMTIHSVLNTYNFSYSYSYPYSLNSFEVSDSWGKFAQTLQDDTNTNDERELSGYLKVEDAEWISTIGVGEISNEDLQYLKLVKYHQKESPYLDWIPRAEVLDLVHASRNAQLFSVYKRTDLEPAAMRGKTLLEMMRGDLLHISVPIELFEIDISGSTKLDPGVYQLLYSNDGVPGFSEDVFTYSSMVREQIQRFRAVMPTGKVTALTVSKDSDTVNYSSIRPRELTLPSNGEVSHFHQINKKI